MNTASLTVPLTFQFEFLFLYIISTVFYLVNVSESIPIMYLGIEKKKKKKTLRADEVQKKKI